MSKTTLIWLNLLTLLAACGVANGQQADPLGSWNDGHDGDLGEHLYQRNRTPEPDGLGWLTTFLVCGVGRGGLVFGRLLVGVRPGGRFGATRGARLSMRAGPTMPSRCRPQARDVTRHPGTHGRRDRCEPHCR